MKAKQAFIYADVEMPQGLKSPLLPEKVQYHLNFRAWMKQKRI